MSRDAKRILQTLADGVDPTTGEVIGRDPLLERVEVVDAFCLAIKALEANSSDSAPLPGPSVSPDQVRETGLIPGGEDPPLVEVTADMLANSKHEEKIRAKNIASGRPRNSGVAWTPAEISFLRDSYLADPNNWSQIADQLERSKGGILMKLKHINVISASECNSFRGR